MNQDLSIIALVLQASLVVQLVMAALLIVSLASWSVIFGKLFGLRRVRSATTPSSASSGPGATSTS
jgi:biopolymer transport protein TolQ